MSTERKNSKDYFEITLDCQKFNSSEIHVTTSEQKILIERKKENCPENSWAARHATRTYPVPSEFDTTSMRTKLENGMLHVYCDHRDQDAKKDAHSGPSSSTKTE
jgi:HSP20 family molecular chaperone IbpA